MSAVYIIPDHVLGSIHSSKSILIGTFNAPNSVGNAYSWLSNADASSGQLSLAFCNARPSSIRSIAADKRSRPADMTWRLASFGAITQFKLASNFDMFRIVSPRRKYGVGRNPTVKLDDSSSTRASAHGRPKKTTCSRSDVNWRLQLDIDVEERTHNP